MGRIPGKVLVLFAITLVLANGACLARCIVQSCQASPPPCHSHSKGDGSHCPQQNQMKTAVTGALTAAWGMALLPVDWPAEAAQAEQPLSFQVATVEPMETALGPLTLRI
jgi:hypothetical protein